MRRPSVRRLLPLLTILLISGFVNASAQSLLKPLERELAGPEQHSYRLKLDAGQFIRAFINQRGIDVVVTLSAPTGEQLIEIDAPVGEWGTEALFFEAKTSGLYTIGVRPFKKAAPQGRYELGFEVRLPVRQDQTSHQAEKTFSQATQLMMQKTPASQDEGLKKYEEALALFASVRDRRGEIRAATTIAESYLFLGESAKALDYFNRTLPLLQSTHDRFGEALTLNNLGLVHYSFGNRKKARASYDQALQIFQALADNRMQGYTHNYIGLIYDSMGENENALASFNRALPLFRAAKDRRGEAQTLNNIGLIYDALGDKEKAREYYEQALALLQDTCNCNEVAPVLSNIAYDFLNSGNKEKALDYLNQALLLQQQVGDRQGEAKTLSNIGFVYNSMGKPEKALGYLTQALAIHSEVGSLAGEGDTLGNLMFTLRAQGNVDAAIFYGKKAVNTYQLVRAALPPLDKEAQRNFLKSRENIYRQLGDLLITQGRIREGQEVLGMLKEEEYYQYVRRDGKTGKTLDSLASLIGEEMKVSKDYQELAASITEKGRRKAELLSKTQRTEEENQLLAKLNEEIRASNRGFQKFLNELPDQLATSFQGRAKATEIKEAVGLQDTLRELGNNAVILYTLIVEDKYKVILITPENRLYHEVKIDSAELYTKVGDFLEALKKGAGAEAELRPLSKYLYDIIVAPVADELKGANAKTLLWSLDGVLRYIPIAALYDGEKYMIEHGYRNVVFTMLSKGNWHKSASEKWTGIGFGVSEPLAGFSALPSVPDELSGIFPKEAIFLNDAFTKDAFLLRLQELPKKKLVHIASHFQYALGNNAESFLLLGKGDKLSMAELAEETSLFGGVELLTLSACETATSRAGEAEGKEVEGFAELAQRQGAMSVLASLWSVNDVGTKILMQKFYKLREAQSGVTKAEALRLAQLEILKGDPRFAHPHYWAPFILIGNWN